MSILVVGATGFGNDPLSDHVCAVKGTLWIAGGTMKNYMGVGVAIGIGVGTALGVALHNIPVWVAVGAALGVILGLAMNRRNRN